MRAFPVLLAATLSALVPLSAMAETLPIEPGEWEIRSVINSVEMPGMPPEALQMMKKSTPQVIRHCVTPEDAAKGPEQLLKEGSGDCKFIEYSLKRERMHAVMECEQPQGKMRVVSNGTYGRTNFSAVADMTSEGMNGMRMNISTSGTRVGNCK